jgi:hypothetical protein
MTDQHGENPTEPTGEGTVQPEGSATPPPAAPASPAPPPAASTSYDMAAAKTSLQEANRVDLGIIGAGVIAFIASLLPFYTASVSAGPISQSDSISAWHGFFGWFAALVALATAVLVALPLFKVNLSLPVPLPQVALGGFVLALVCLILALFVTPGGGCPDTSGLGIDCDTGRGFGFWLALLAVLAGAALSFLRAKETMAKTA